MATNTMASFTSPRPLRTSLLGVALAGLSWMAGSVNAADPFTVTATVQNAVTLTQVTPLSFGTVFATETDATDSATLTLSPLGAISAGTAVTGVPLFALSGSTAGSFSAPNLPGNAKVGIAVTNADGVDLDNSADVATAAADCNAATSAAALAAGKIVLTHSSGDPSVGFFCVDALTSDRADLLPVGALAATGYSLGFGITTLTFKLGATLLTQAVDDKTYEPGAYTGTINMEVVLP